jgi:hypothetical protein
MEEALVILPRWIVLGIRIYLLGICVKIFSGSSGSFFLGVGLEPQVSVEEGKEIDGRNVASFRLQGLFTKDFV